MRVGVEGELFRKIQFQVEREFSESEINDPADVSTKTQWKDVYVEVELRERRSDSRRQVQDPVRSRPDERRIGSRLRLPLARRQLPVARHATSAAMVHGRFFDRGLNYWVGGFEQDGDNSRSSKIAGGDTTIRRARHGPAVSPNQALATAEIGGSFATSAAVRRIAAAQRPARRGR